MKVAIVGLPNAGKSSVFNALTRAQAEAASYPFTTVEPNVATVPVTDTRLDRVCATVGATGVVYETITFCDIAGLVQNAHTGEGLGNQFLAQIRDCDAIAHVVRCHDDPGVAHPEGRIDPVADIETVETELVYADLEQAQRRLERVSRQAKSQEQGLVSEQNWLGTVIATLEHGEPARFAPPPPEDARHAMSDLQPLTAKPVLYVANVSEEDSMSVPARVAQYAREHGSTAVAISARIEAELSELDPDQAEQMREGLGMKRSGMEELIKTAFSLLDLITFFTADEGSEARAHAVPEGTTAAQGAGKVHTDMQRGFIRAEVIAWDELVELGGYHAAREGGNLRVEGRDYRLADGEVMLVRFRA